MILTILTIFILLCVTAIILKFTITVWMDLYERIWGSNAEFTDKLIKENKALERRLKYYEAGFMTIISEDIRFARDVAARVLEKGKNV